MEDLKILYEMTEKRDQYTKHFRTEKNHCVAAVYTNPVHYEKNGIWNEIDNTLELKVDEKGKEYYENRDSRMKVKFSKSMNSDSLITVKKDGYKIDWSLVLPHETFKDTAKNAAKTIEFLHVSKTDKLNRKMKTRQANPKTVEEINQEKMALDHVEEQGIYKNVTEDLDVQYNINGETLKENIIIKSRKGVGKPVTFNIAHKGLNARMEPDKSITLFVPEQPNKVIYQFAIPFMYDANGAYSENVHYELKEYGENSLITTVPDKNWLQAEDRAFPVVIDPVTETSKATKDIDDTFVKEKAPNSSVVASYGSFYVGNNSEYGKCRSFLKFNNLPSIDKGSIIYDARMYVWQYKFSANTDTGFYITAHKVNGGWSGGNTTWNNQPGYDANVLDYAYIDKVKNGNTVSITPKSFNITKLVRDWYNTGVNNGIMLKSMDENLKSEGVFVTSDHPPGDAYNITSDQFPSGVFYYRNVNGLEEYQSYHEQNVGRAGTGYTNDYNGNVVFIHKDTETTGNLLPIVVNHVYNLSECDTSSRMGQGWRLSVMQELKETGKKDFPYVYIDEDGTKHYFYKDTEDGNKLKDEDGLGLTITMTSSGNHDEYRTIETKEKLKYIFGADGYLRRIRDLNGNTTSFQYGPHSTGNYLGYITDATGATIHFHYTSDMVHLEGITDALGRKISFHYDSGRRMTSIDYPDGKVTKYSYSGNKLSKVTSSDGYAVEYSYNDDMRVPRVSKISEWGGNKVGQVLKIAYKNGNTTVFEEPGLDGNIDTTGDNKIITYHFDNTGRPSDISDSDGYANSYQYYAEGMKNNKLSKTGATQKTIYNYIRNPRFDPAHATGDGWNTHRFTGETTGTVSRVSDEGYLGNNSIKVVKTDLTSVCGIKQEISLKAGSYTLSAYVKTKAIEKKDNSGAGICVITSDGTVISGPYTTGTTDTNIDKGWERQNITFTLSKDETISIFGGIFRTTGTAWFDCFQVEKGTVANKFNMLCNPGFKYGSGNKIENWGCSHYNTNDGRVTDPVRGYCGGIGGEISLNKQLSQAVNLIGEEGDIYSLSCWVKANAIPGKIFRISAAVIYESGDPKWHDFDCNPNITDWQFVSGIFSTDDQNGAVKRKYKAIHIYLFYHNQLNRVYFEGAQLIKEDGESYGYDSQGNLVNAKSAAEKSGFVYDNKNNLSKMGDIDGTAFEYAYNDKNNLTKARNSEGIEYTFAYDSKGNPVSSIAQHTGSSTSVTAGRTYYIRQKKSGKYLDLQGAADSDRTPILQFNFNGTNAQKWKIVDAEDGYYKLVSLASRSGRVIDVPGAADVSGTKLQLHADNNSNAQKFKIKPLSGNVYQVIAKCSKDKKAIEAVGQSTDNGVGVQISNQSETSESQLWYFEPADERDVSPAPQKGKTYHIRVLHSGLYLDVSGHYTTAGTKIHQWVYSGAKNQQFTLSDAGSGYYYLEPVHAPGMVLSKTGKNAEGHNAITLQNKNEGDYKQHFQFVKSGNEYGIICREDGAGFDVAHFSNSNGADVIATGQSGNNFSVNKKWILEEYDKDNVSAVPKNGKTYQIRVRHSGMYLDVYGISTTAGTKTQQCYYNGGKNQQFTLTDAGGGYYYLEPVHASGMALSKTGQTSEGHNAITLQKKSEGDHKQHFQFVKSGYEYGIVCRDGNAGLDVAHLSFTSGADIIATGQSGNNFGLNKKWILEECSERIESSMTYTEDGRHVKTVKDSRGNETTNTYDSKNRLLTAVTDANGNITDYTYDSNTDQLLSVSKKVGNKEIKISYMYENDKLKTIGHNGFSYNFGYDEFGNDTSVSVGNQVLEKIQYLPNNGPMSSITYGNGAVLSNVYDKNYNIIEQKLDGTIVYKNKYDDYGDMIEHQDLPNGVTYNYKYDLIDRLIGVNTSHGQALRTAYDKKNRINYSVHQVNGTGTKVQYMYGDVYGKQKPGLIYGVKVDDAVRVRYTYDTFARMKKRTLTLENNGRYVSAYEFLKGVGTGTTTTLVSSLTNGSDKLGYSYDKLGNIKTISENKQLKASYVYDEIGQLIRENSVWENKSIMYTYDAGGNILSRKEYELKVVGEVGSVQNEVLYAYEDANWKDKLTSYDGQSITYDSIGNPLHYRDNMKITWQNGRELSTLTKNDLTVTYQYDNEGIRTRKIVNGVATQFYLSGSDIVTQIKGNERMDFFRDDEGELLGFKYNGENYYYILNLQNDIIGILDKTGVKIVSYAYDSWGRLLTVSGSEKDTIGQMNPFRYRGYYYDTETGFYLTDTRYYDPLVGRFISADTSDVLDAKIEHFNQYNLFAYCFNNPINMTDGEGTWPQWATNLVKVGIGALAIGIGVAATVATGGSAIPVLIASVKIATATAAVGAVGGAAASAISHKVSTGSWKGAGKAARNGAVNGAANGFMLGGIAAGATYTFAAARGVTIQKIGRIKPSNKKGKGYLGVKYGIKKGNRVRVRSFELHSPHKRGPHNKWHWQRNVWNDRFNTISSSKHWRLFGKRFKKK